MLAHDPTYSLSQLLEDALTAEIDRLQQIYNHGDAWPNVHTVRPGRRTGSNGERSEPQEAAPPVDRVEGPNKFVR